MKNPFYDFRPGSYDKEDTSARRLHKDKQGLMETILEGYLQVVEHQIQDMVWLVEHDRVARTYSDAVHRMRDVQVKGEDIEEFCAELDQAGNIAYRLAGPAGVYLSALINLSTEDRITLRLCDYRRAFHFVGYRLPRNKELIIHGDAGDFCGAGLYGGTLTVMGSVGNWCGAGMLKGEITIRDQCGLNTGEWMHDGVIRVGGPVEGVGGTLFGGSIYQEGRVVYS